MNVSIEDAHETETRLKQVLANASIKWFDEPFAFFEYSTHIPLPYDGQLLALVRDGECWSALQPAAETSLELFGVFSFHFPEDLDNSGFVGWLASLLKGRFGTGVFVICGHNSERGGIFDYWGVPYSLIGEVRKFVEEI